MEQRSDTDLARLTRRVLRADDIFVPYDADFPQHTFPNALSGLPVGIRQSAAGWGMTFRREVCLKEPFEEILSYYAAGELGHEIPCLTSRIDANSVRSTTLSSWRDKWPLAPICRPGDRGLHPIVLHRLYSTDIDRSRSRMRRLLWRRFPDSARQGSFALSPFNPQRPWHPVRVGTSRHNFKQNRGGTARLVS